MNKFKKELKILKKRYKTPLEIKKIGKSYYVYNTTTVWDKKEKKRKKISRYLGRMTETGFKEKDEGRYNARSIYEYGNIKLLYDIISEELEAKLRKTFPMEYEEIIAMGMIRVLKPTPLRLMKSRWEKYYISKEIEASLSPAIASERIKRIGADVGGQIEFYKSLIDESQKLIFDLSCLYSQSMNINLAEKGYNKDKIRIQQINFLLIYSTDKGVPVMIKAMPGSIRELKSLKNIIKEIKIKDCILVLDRGYGSNYLPELMEEKEAKYIVCLQRGFKIIDYEIKMEGAFIYRGRGVRWGKKEVGGKWVYLYEDVKLKSEEETEYIREITEGRKDMSRYEEEKKKFGKFALLSNINKSGEEIYKMYKEREEVELAFDAMKNELENDKIYLTETEGVYGYFFISFISLYLYFRILGMLRESGLIERMSVEEVLHELSKVYLVEYRDGKKRLTEIPKKVEEIVRALRLNLFPKELQS